MRMSRKRVERKGDGAGNVFFFIFYIFIFISDVARRVTERVPAGDVKWPALAALAPLSLVHLLSVQPRAICAMYSLCQEKQIREVLVAG